ncbi:hypothetical protein C8R44DRAFT_756503 [Mycena epipterygia]|nr:hypothetical protein C8R44DRAFT_756503 [Mycena epipterygia]
MLVSNNLHPLINRKKVMILKTPNRVLACTDILAPSNGNTTLLGDVKYSKNPRYTLQWLVDGTPHQQRDFPNNMDAVFKKHFEKAKLLLHYNYGVAALRWWGKGPEKLLTARKRPAPPIAAPLGPSRSKDDRSAKTQDARTKSEGFQDGSDGNREEEDIDERRQFQAERLVISFIRILLPHEVAARSSRRNAKIGWPSGGMGSA